MYLGRTYTHFHRWITESLKTQMRKSSRLTFDKKALSNAMSATILTVAVIALSLAVFRWGEGRASSYNNDFDRAVDRETAELKEKIIFEYVSYDKTSNDITVYLLNCGDIDDVEIKSVFVANGSWLQHFSTPILKFFNGSF